MFENVSYGLHPLYSEFDLMQQSYHSRDNVSIVHINNQVSVGIRLHPPTVSDGSEILCLPENAAS